MKPLSTTSIWPPLKKVNLVGFKKSDKPAPLKIENKVQELENNCDFFSKCAILSHDQTIDMQNIISTYELSTIPRSFFDVAREPNDGGGNKSQMVYVLVFLEHGLIPFLSPPLKIDVSILGAMEVLHNTKSSDVKTLVTFSFSNKVGDLSHSASTKVVSCDTYKDLSLKERTRIARKGDVIPVEFEVSESTAVSEVGMKQILSHKRTKQALTNYLVVKMWEHLRKGVEEFVVAGDGVSVN